MTIQLLDNVMSPEHGVRIMTGGPPPFMGAAPSAGRRPGGGNAPSPMMPPPPIPDSMAKRLDTLEKKTVYLVDTGFGGSYQFMLQLQKWFKENMPSVTTIRKRKPGNVFMDDNNELWEEVKVKGDAVVLGVAG